MGFDKDQVINCERSHSPTSMAQNYGVDTTPPIGQPGRIVVKCPLRLPANRPLTPMMGEGPKGHLRVVSNRFSSARFPSADSLT